MDLLFKREDLSLITKDPTLAKPATGANGADFVKK